MDLVKPGLVPSHVAAKYEAEAATYWTLFYQRNQDRFFKDRHYFEQEFPQLLDAEVVLEVGCGAGNTVFPLLELNPRVRIWACDFAPSAVELVQAHPQYAASGRVCGFVADIAADDLVAKGVPAAGVDICTMVFVLSALAPEAMPQALRAVAATLRPGTGLVLFRDYAAGDLAAERMGQQGRQQRLSDNFYVRGDGTCAYYFTQDGLVALFEAAGFCCESVQLKEREVQNRRQGQSWGRRFLQAAFRYTSKLPQQQGGDAPAAQRAPGAAVKTLGALAAGPSLDALQPPLQQVQVELLAGLRLDLCCLPQAAAAQLAAAGRASPTSLAPFGLSAASRALAGAAAACPWLLQNCDVVELGCGATALPSLVALRWCRRAVATDASCAALELLRRNARRNGALFVIERLRLQQLDWGQPHGEQHGQLRQAFPAGFGVVLAAPPEATLLPRLLCTTAALLSRQQQPQHAMALVCLERSSGMAAAVAAEQAARVGLRLVPPPPQAAAAAAAAGGQLLCMQHAEEAV